RRLSVKLRPACPLNFGQHATRQRTLRLSVRYDCGLSSSARAAVFGPSNSMLELRPTKPQGYPEWSGFIRPREREWVTSGNRPRDKSGEPTHAHLHDRQRRNYAVPRAFGHSKRGRDRRHFEAGTAGRLAQRQTADGHAEG